MAASTCFVFPDKQQEIWQWREEHPAAVISHPIRNDIGTKDGLWASRGSLEATPARFDCDIKGVIGHVEQEPQMFSAPITIAPPAAAVSDHIDSFEMKKTVDEAWKQDVHVVVTEALATPSTSSSGSSSLVAAFERARTARDEKTSASDVAPTKVRSACLFDPLTLTIREALQAMAAGAYTSEDIVEVLLDRIARFNDQLRAVIATCPPAIALALARQRDVERDAGQIRGPLHGVPIIVKDNIATDEELGMLTTAGSYALVGMPVRGDAFIVERLRDAGAIIIGKANMSELNDAKSSAASPGWSAVGGQTVSAFGQHVEVGTSSSGSGVAVAAGFCLASVGTETDGSITLPCLYSGLYGLKPTVGLLSRTGVLPYTHHMDSPGPMCKSVWDVAVMMDAMVGWDGEDVKSFEDIGVSYTEGIDEASFAGLRIGIPREGFFFQDPWGQKSKDKLAAEVLASIQNVVRTLQDEGAEITDPADLPSVLDGSFKAAQPDRSLVITAEYKEYLGRYLRGLGGEGGCRSTDDIIEFNEANAALEMPLGHYGQDVLKRTEHAVSVDSPDYEIAMTRMIEAAGPHGIDAVMDQYSLDALLLFRRGGHTPANMVGYPIATVPIGVDDDGQPFGAFFIGRAHSERKLLRIMSAWEKVMPARPLARAFEAA